MNKVIQRAVIDAIPGTDLDAVDKIIASVSLYNAILKRSGMEESGLGNVYRLATSLGELHVGLIHNFRNTYVSYNVIKNYINKYKINNFLQLTDSQYNQILEWYFDKTEIVSFNTFGYTHHMYKITEITDSNNVYLKNIHDNVMVPIYRYYNTKFNIRQEDLNIVDAELSEVRPGKDMLFEVIGIDSGKIVSDIKRKKLLIPDRYLEEVFLEDNYVRILIK